MPRPPARNKTAIAEAFTRAVSEPKSGYQLPRRFTDSETDGNPASRTITDTETGRSSTVNVTCFGSVRRVLAELFPDDPVSGP